MGRGIGVKADVVRPRVSKHRRQRIDRLHHQVHIHRHRRAIHFFGVRLDGLADHRAEGQVGHVMVVHHIEVDPVGPGVDHAVHLLAQESKVG